MSCDIKNLRFALNASKTQYMIFNTPSCLIIEYNNKVIQKADNFKYIGVTHDSKLKFKNHTDL